MRRILLIPLAIAAAAALTVGVIAATAGNGSTSAKGQMHSMHAMTTATCS